MINTRPSQDQVLLHVAFAIAARGTCQNLQVGAVVAREGRILSTGYNGRASGMSHCDHGKRAEGDPIVVCGAIHAEANAIAFAARHGTALLGAEMICTDSPCIKCAQMIIQSGIISFKFSREYRVHDGVNLLIQAGVDVQEI